MPAQRYRYIGETPVMVPDLNWGGDDSPVMPGDVSPPSDLELVSEVVVLVGSDAEKAWLAANRPADKPAKGSGS